MNDIVTYAARLKDWYRGVSGWASVEQIVGNYDFHENFPYETQLLYRYGDVRRPIFDYFAARKAFDIGCGEGRMIRRMSKMFGQVDGCDVSQAMVRAAIDRCPGSNVWETNGLSCGGAPSDSYDFAFCTISLQHIGVYDVRKAIIRDVSRILKGDGKMTLQMVFSAEFPYTPCRAEWMDSEQSRSVIYSRDCVSAGYFENDTGSESSNGSRDCMIGVWNLDAVRADFLEYFETCEFWFHDISVSRRYNILPETHPNCHGNVTSNQTHYIFIHCETPRRS